MRTLLLTLISFSVTVTAMAQDAIDDTRREATEWLILRWEQAPDTTLPRVLLVGDSIANGYAGEVSRLLGGKAHVDLLATSKSICDPALLKEVELATDGYQHAVIHFNNGLHGGHLTDAQYEAGLRRLVARLRGLAPQAKLVWASSTSAVTLPDKQLDPNLNPKIIHRNEIAARVMAELGLPIDDLYGVAATRNDWHSDTLHFSAEGCTALAQAVSESVSARLNP